MHKQAAGSSRIFLAHLELDRIHHIILQLQSTNNNLSHHLIIRFDSHINQNTKNQEPTTNYTQQPPWHPTAKTRCNRSAATLALDTEDRRPLRSTAHPAAAKCHRPHQKTTSSSSRATPTSTGKGGMMLLMWCVVASYHVRLLVSTFSRIENSRFFAEERKDTYAAPRADQFSPLMSLPNICLPQPISTPIPILIQTRPWSPRHRGKALHPSIPIPPFRRLDVPFEHRRRPARCHQSSFLAVSSKAQRGVHLHGGH